MDARRALTLALCACLLALAAPALAQPGSLGLLAPVTGTLRAGETQSWAFSAVEGAVVSLLLEAESGDLDPLLRVTTSAGVEIFSADDYNYPDSTDALLEAITLPRLDTYTVTVAGFGGTAGGYRLTLLPGFAALAWGETFDTESAWDSASAQLTLNISGGQLALQLDGAQQRAVATPAAAPPLADFYARAQVAEVTGRAGWLVGLTARQQDARSYYLFQVSSQGQWRFLIRAPLGDRVVRDWAAHPAIAPGATAFTLGLMANGSGFDLFYNDLFLSHIVDDTLAAAGAVGLVVETPAAGADAQVIARFEAVSVTTPRPLDDGRVIPDQLLISRDGRAMARDLQRRHLIPAGGTMRLTVPESFVTFNRPGVNRIALAGGQAFSALAMGTTVTWDINTAAGPAGCGLVVRAASDTRYVLAYLDQTGGYGVSEYSDGAFEPGIFGENPALTGSSHHLLVIASGTALRYYVNGRYAGTLTVTAEGGGVAVAAVNFEPAATSCTFSDTWLWSWD